MPIQLSFNLVLIFFVYGLAFFSMGLALSLETGRAPLLAQTQALRPLAWFGFIHGFHEWFEMALLLGEWFEQPAPAFAPWLRLGFLLASFSALLYYALLVLRANTRRWQFLDNSGLLLIWLAAYLIIIWLSQLLWPAFPPQALIRLDALARYTIAAPGALLAAWALGRQAVQARKQDHASLALSLNLAAWAFAGYTLTQLIVPPADFFPTNIINAIAFYKLSGIPIQVFRAILAILITLGLLRATQMAERERHQAWIDAQEERLEAILQVQHELAEREAMRRELLRHTVLAQEEERTRIARELHDETAQFLTTLSLDLATVQKHFNPQSQPYSLLERLQRLSSQMSEGIHRMVHDLRPAQLDDLGLAAGLRYLVDETRRQGLRVEIEFTGQRQRLDPLVETVCFRIAQEAFTNTIRHAHAHRVKIHLAYLSQKVLLQIQDDGIGFDPTKRQIGQPGLGLAGMQERAESVGGILRIDSSPGHGTLVECTIPAAYVQAQEVSAYEDHSHPVG